MTPPGQAAFFVAAQTGNGRDEETYRLENNVG